MSVTVGQAWLDWRKAVCESDLPATARHVLLVLSLYPSAMTPVPFPSLRELGRMCAHNAEVVRRNLALAEKAGWIRREARFVEDGKGGGRQTSNAYLLTTPGAPPPTKSRGAPPTKSRAQEGDNVKGSASNEAHTCEPDLFGGGLPAGRIDYTPAFEEVWAIHPRGGKKPAFAAYRKALKDKRVAHGVLVAKLRAYVATFRNGFRGAALHRWVRDEQWHERLDGGGVDDQDRFVLEELERRRQLQAGGGG